MSSLQRLQEHCDLVIVTSRQHIIRQPTLDWIDTHFPAIFSEVHFGNHYALEGVPKKKSEMCKCVEGYVRATVLLMWQPIVNNGARQSLDDSMVMA